MNIQNNITNIIKGSKAPNIISQYKDNRFLKKINLQFNNLLKPIALFFIPLAFTPTCTKTFCFLSNDNNINNFYIKNKNKIDIYGISVDSPFTLYEWKKKHNIKFILLSDFNKKISKQYNVLTKNFLGFKNLSWRSIFIINKKGLINYVWKAPLNNGNEFPNMKLIYKEVNKVI